MSSMNTSFCREMLKKAFADLTKEQKKHYHAHSWTWTDGNGHWEFHMPLGSLSPNGGEVYWYGDADNAFDARYHGLVEFFVQYGNDEQRKAYEY